VLVSASSKRDRRSIPRESVAAFCDQICASPPASIQLHFIRDNRPSGREPSEIGDNDWKPVLALFGTLRNVAQFSATDGIDPKDESAVSERFTSLLGDEVSAADTQRLKFLVEGDTPVERLSLMHKALMDYASSFERCERFRKAMQSPAGRARERRITRQEQGDRDVYKAYQYPGSSSQFSNPFKEHPLHPVEDILELAAIATDDGNSADFKGYRRQILTYLEPQYRRIVEASAALENFIAEKNQECVMFGDEAAGCPYVETPWGIKDRCGIGSILVEDYAKSFRRDMPLAARSKVRLIKQQFDQIYSLLPREKLFAELARIVSSHEVDGDLFLEVFQNLVDDMNDQLLSIQNARNALFKHDSSENLWSECYSWMENSNVWNEADSKGMVRKTILSHVHICKICPPPEWNYSCRPGRGRAFDLDAGYPWSGDNRAALGSGDGTGDENIDLCAGRYG
jgi:hypothetical protein